MKFTEAKIAGLLIIEPEIHEDSRGAFWRTFDREELTKHGVSFKVVQGNSTLTQREGSVRGMHFQVNPRAEDKIVQCLNGAIFDVAVDMRESSPTFGKWSSVELSDKNRKCFFIPKGFAHGFQSLTNNCLVHYYMSEFYSPEHASGVRWDDPQINIKWPLPIHDISKKDQSWPTMQGLQ